LPDKLIIFDYSGTLSLEMAGFSSPDNLLPQLRQSGLYGLGVDSLDLFWNIVNATWTKGSTTKVGYKKVLTKYISGLFPEKAATEPMQISAAVAAFAAAYFAHSHMDEHWRPVLEKLARDESVQAVIATDHYAEATNAIIKFLAEWQIKAVPLKASCTSNFVIANSADMGMHKAQRQFWEIVKDALQSEYNKILLIDDFGQNEQPGDNYGIVDKIDARRKSTILLLQDVFITNVELFSFNAHGKQQDELIAGALAAIDKFLST
jgi:hypothetical protein